MFHLQAMENDNPHGAGVAWEVAGTIQFVKGLTAKQIFDMQEAGAMTYPYLMHYRWATHGDKVPEWTHPFPLGPRALMGETAGSCNALLIHNGTWGRYNVEASSYVNEGNYELPEELLSEGSDTAIAAWLALDNPDILDGVMWATAVAEMRDGSMDITTRGQWYDKDGNWYSNLNWVPNDYSYKHWTYESYVKRKEEEALQARIDKLVDSEKAPYQGQKWYPELDEHKPEGLDWDVWYLQFDWTDVDARYGASVRDHVQKSLTVADAAKREEYAQASTSGITWEEYVAKYGNPTDKKAEGLSSPAGDPEWLLDSEASPLVVKEKSAGYSDLEWNDYLVARYGPEVAGDIIRGLAVEHEGEGCEADCYQANMPLVDIDIDLVSEDPSTVNEVLSRQSLGMIVKAING